VNNIEFITCVIAPDDGYGWTRHLGGEHGARPGVASSATQELLLLRSKRTASHVAFVEHVLGNSVWQSFKPPLCFSLATAQNACCFLFRWSGRVFHHLSVIETDRKDCAGSSVRATPLPLPTPEGFANYKFTMFQKVTYVP
jgi:hypothetical protein